MTAVLRRRLAEVQLALILLTRLPAGTLRPPIPSMVAARWAFPLVGLVVGVVAWASQYGALALGLGPMVAGLATVCVVVLVTGALHFDGLADFADGMGGGRDRAHCLEIMRDSRIGSYGVLALVLGVGLMVAGLARFHEGAPLAVFLLAAVGSRFVMSALLDRLPPARTDGLGQEAAGRSGGAWVPGALCLGGLALWIGPGAGAALLAMGAAAGLVGWLAVRRIGGQTGDVLGAAQMLAEIAAILALAAILQPS